MAYGARKIGRIVDQMFSTLILLFFNLNQPSSGVKSLATVGEIRATGKVASPNVGSEGEPEKRPIGVTASNLKQPAA